MLQVPTIYTSFGDITNAMFSYNASIAFRSSAMRKNEMTIEIEHCVHKYISRDPSHHGPNQNRDPLATR